MQEFLAFHQANGKEFVEVDKEADASVEVDNLDFVLEAQIVAKDLDVEMLETIARVVIGLNIEKMSSSELKET